MSDPKSAPVSTPVGAAHSFGPIHPLVLGLSLEGIERRISTALLSLDINAIAQVRTELQEAKAKLRMLAVEAFQESDRLEHAAVAASEAAAKAKIGTPVHAPDPAMTPTGQMAPMPPLSGYEQNFHDAIDVQKATPIKQRAKRWFGWGHLAFVILLALLIALVVAIGGKSHPGTISPATSSQGPSAVSAPVLR